MKGYTYHQAIGWNSITIEKDKPSSLLIGYACSDNAENIVWINDLWIENTFSSEEEQQYFKLTSLNLGIELEKYIINNSMTLSIDFYDNLPDSIQAQYNGYSQEDLQQYKIGKLEHSIEQGPEKKYTLSLDNIPNIYLPNKYYIHIYCIANVNSSNNIKAYLTHISAEKDNNSFLKTTVQYDIYYPYSKHIKEIVKKDYYITSEESFAPNSIPDDKEPLFGYKFESTQADENNYKYLVKQVYDDQTSIGITIKGGFANIERIDKITDYKLWKQYKLTYDTTKHYELINWKINDKNYGNLNPFIFTLTPDMITENYKCEISVETTPIEYQIWGTMLDKVYVFTKESERPTWPSLNLPRGLQHIGWKDINTSRSYTADEVMPLISMQVEPIFENSIQFTINDDSTISTKALEYNPLGYYSLEPLTSEDKSIYAFTTGLSADKTPTGPVYSIHEVMDVNTFNTYFSENGTLLYPLKHDISGKTLTVYEHDNTQWSNKKSGYLYQKTKEGVWKRVN